jgi:hypothetical protein
MALGFRHRFHLLFLLLPIRLPDFEQARARNSMRPYLHVPNASDVANLIRPVRTAQP